MKSAQKCSNIVFQEGALRALPPPHTIWGSPEAIRNRVTRILIMCDICWLDWFFFIWIFTILSIFFISGKFEVLFGSHCYDQQCNCRNKHLFKFITDSKYFLMENHIFLFPFPHKFIALKTIQHGIHITDIRRFNRIK